MADDAVADAVVEPEITIEDFDGEEPPKAESTPAKEEKPEPKAEETKEEIKSPEVTEPDEAKKPEDEEKPPAEQRKEQLNTEIRDLVSQRNALKEEVSKVNSEVYQVATEDELVQEGLSATDAKVEALRQQIEMRDFNEKVADAQLTLSSESERVLKDFPQFNPDSDNYDKELAEEASELLKANLIVDPNSNQIIGSNFSPYQLYKTLSRASGISSVKGEIKGQQNTEKQLANVDAGSTASPPSKKVDPLDELWSEPLV